jgi:hypothetical protein
MTFDLNPRVALGATALVAFMLAGCGGPVDSNSADAASTAGSGAAPAADPSALPTAPGADAGQARRAAAAASALAAEEALPLKDQVAQLRRELAELRRIVARLPNAAAVAAEGPDPRTDPNARAAAERAEQERVASAEAAFRREAYDPRAGQAQADSVRAALREGSEGLGNHLGSVECRGQSCRVELNADPHSRAMQELPITLARLGDSFPNVTAGQVDRGDGRSATVMYLSR